MLESHHFADLVQQFQFGIWKDALEATDNRGQSALDIARMREEEEKIDLLREYGVD